MKYLLIISLCLALFSNVGCVHRTSMSDPLLRNLYNGQPLDAKSVTDASAKWPNDTTLIEMQEAFALLRNGDYSSDARAEAKRYLEKATQSFEDLQQPNNFSTAFTPDSKTPYRGRPYERVLASMFLGILDMADGRCDMAIPSLKAAEFLDARWQPFQFGTDAPMVYALRLRCLIQTGSSAGDIARAKDGLFRSIRMLESLESLRVAFERYSQDLANQAPAIQASFLILEAGVSSALMEADMDANADDIFKRIVSDSLRYYVQVLSNKDDSMFDTFQVVAKKVEKNVGSKEKIPSAQGLAQIEAALKNLVAQANTSSKLKTAIENKIAHALASTDAIIAAVSKPKTILSFDGDGPHIVAEGQHHEVARIVPGKESDAKPGAPLAEIKVSEQCGVHKRKNRGLDVVLCDDTALRRDGAQAQDNSRLWAGIKLWSSSYQATSMVGRRFDKILKGRAEFRAGSETAAAIGAVTAIALLEISSQYARECAATGRNCEAARNMQLAGAVAGLLAGGAFLAGRAVSPEADTRHLTDAFESGYLMLKSRE